jgi:hypothetical protein
MIEQMRELADQLVAMDPRIPGLTPEQKKYRQDESLLIRSAIKRIWEATKPPTAPGQR